MTRTFDSRTVRFTIGTAIAGVIAGGGAVWKAATIWNNSQARIDRIEKHIEYNDRRLDRLTPNNPQPERATNGR